METTKKTSTTRAALLVIAALSMLLSGLFIATASRSDASPASACPDGFSLTADAKNCFQAASVTSADNANSCPAGQITPDGSNCWVAAQVIPQAGTTVCPAGYSQDDSLGGMCARFAAATQGAETCPAGSHGVKDSCYIYVAKGPGTAGVCEGDSVAQGAVCVEEGDERFRDFTCVEVGNVVSDGERCYTVTKPAGGADDCDGTWNEVDDQCETDAELTPGAWTCAAGQVYQAPICVIITDPGDGLNPSCPIGSYEDASGDCRKPVANAKGAYSCADAASALNGKTCVWTSAFSVTITPDMYKCAEGARAVIGTDVICVLSASDANTTSAPSCLQGVLSTDGAYCIVPRSDAAPAAVAPVPSFTG